MILCSVIFDLQLFTRLCFVCHLLSAIKNLFIQPIWYKAPIFLDPHTQHYPVQEYLAKYLSFKNKKDKGNSDQVSMIFLTKFKSLNLAFRFLLSYWMKPVKFYPFDFYKTHEFAAKLISFFETDSLIWRQNFHLCFVKSRLTHFLVRIYVIILASLTSTLGYTLHGLL